MRHFTRQRLTKLERRLPAPGGLPTVIEVPAGEPQRSQVLADIERRRAKGANILVVSEGADPLGALVEAAAP